ncbi:MAG: inositol monophosphatase [Rhodospirillaceae bacterium]|nr:inositol monophosphatase [Rhodospirillaceae bacterium]MBT6139014.1 inositol monophosphatase [Rhodospirillaceae bacterium]
MKHDRSIQLPDPCDLINSVATAVVVAGALLRAEFHRPGGPRGAHSQAPIDTEIEKLLRTRLMALHACDWHGEELPHIYSGHPDVWVVDPHDGTRAFLKGLRGSAISVALLRCGEPVLGIVYAPMAPDDAGDFFIWAVGLPPMRNGVALVPIGPNPVPITSKVLPDIPASWPGRPCVPHVYGTDTVIGLNEEAGDYAAFNHVKLTPASVLAMPSIAYRLALAASGEVDVAVSLTSGLDPYDVAGGHALLTAVDGGFVQLNGKAIVYGPRATFQGCIGGRPELLREIVKRCLTSAPMGRTEGFS